MKEWEVAQAVYGRSTPEGIAWAKQGCSWLVHGEIETLVTSIEALPPVAPPPGQSRSVPEQALGYFTTNAQRMRYPHFRAQGMHVGSGMAEAACKTVVSTRAKRAGMRPPSRGLRRPLTLAHRCPQSHLRCLLAKPLCCSFLMSSQLIHTPSNGSNIDNPRFLREEEKALAKAQRRSDQEAKGTKERRKRNKVVVRIHERVKSRRQNFIGQQVALLVKRFGLIAVEALVVRNMAKRPKPIKDEVTGQYLPNRASQKSGLNKSIEDAAWSAFFTALLAKVEETERTVIKVPPASATQTCHACGHRQEMPMSVRVYTCENCGLVCDRDHNASLTILQKAVGRHGHVIREALALEA